MIVGASVSESIEKFTSAEQFGVGNEESQAFIVKAFVHSDNAGENGQHENVPPVIIVAEQTSVAQT